MPKAQLTNNEHSKQAILRMSSAVEDAPYAIDSIEVLNTRATASCITDDMNVRRLKGVASCGSLIAHAASCTSKEPRT